MRTFLGVLVAATVVLAGSAGYLNASASDVVVVNAGRDTVVVRGAMPSGAETLLAFAGVRNVPDELQPGVPTALRVPALSGLVEHAPGAIGVTLFGQSMVLNAACDALELDGATLVGRQTTFNLGDRPRHDLRFACR